MEAKAPVQGSGEMASTEGSSQRCRKMTGELSDRGMLMSTRCFRPQPLERVPARLVPGKTPIADDSSPCRNTNELRGLFFNNLDNATWANNGEQLLVPTFFDSGLLGIAVTIQ